jgi:hypothetical protein
MKSLIKSRARFAVFFQISPIKPPAERAAPDPGLRHSLSENFTISRGTQPL